MNDNMGSLRVEMYNPVETNIMSEEYQQRMREALHELMVDEPQSTQEIGKKLGGMCRQTVAGFLYKKKSLQTKEDYMLLKFLKSHFSDF